MTGFSDRHNELIQVAGSRGCNRLFRLSRMMAQAAIANLFRSLRLAVSKWWAFQATAAAQIAMQLWYDNEGQALQTALSTL